MRIIGGHDYFDSALAFGQDRDLVFTRSRFDDTLLTEAKSCGLVYPKQGYIDLREKYGSDIVYRTKNHKYTFTSMTVWFAGKRYGGVMANKDCLWHPHTSSNEYFWKLDPLLQYIDEIGAEINNSSKWNGTRSLNKGNIAEHFTSDGSQSEIDWMIENNVSIAIKNIGVNHDRNEGWFLNTDGLKDIGFMRVLDAYSAFQELSMWVGGVLPKSERPMIRITDEKTQLQKHGMDEWSFKNPPKIKNR